MNPFLQAEFPDLPPEFPITGLKHELAKLDELVKALRIKYDHTKTLGIIRRDPMFQELVLSIRDWEKSDAHCHVSDSLDDEYCSGKLKTFPGDFKPHGNRIKDIWIRKPEDLASAVGRAVSNYFDDRVFNFAIRFNPYKKAFDKLSIAVIQEVLDLCHHKITEMERETNSQCCVEFCFSLSREKYGWEGISKIAKALIKIKESSNGDLRNRMAYVDISGQEMQPWECDIDGYVSDSLKQLLKELREQGQFKLVSHLGHSRTVHQRFKAMTKRNCISRLRYMLDYIEAGIERIGHASNVSKAMQNFVGSDNAEWQQLMELIRNRPIQLERCPSGKWKTLGNVREDPIFFWQTKDFDFKLGIDGLRRAISLSQWIALLAVVGEGAEWSLSNIREKRLL